jgi:hypothetical protein
MNNEKSTSVELNIHLIFLSLNKIYKYTKAMSFNKYKSDEKTKDAVLECMRVIGNSSTQIPFNFRILHKEIPWDLFVSCKYVDAECSYDIFYNKTYGLKIFTNYIKNYLDSFYNKTSDIVDTNKRYSLTQLVKWAQNEGNYLVNLWIDESNEQNCTLMTISFLKIKNIVNVWTDYDNLNPNSNKIIISNSDENEKRLFSVSNLRLAIDLLSKQSPKNPYKIPEVKMRTHVSIWTIKNK